MIPGYGMGNALEVGHRQVLVDGQSLALVEHGGALPILMLHVAGMSFLGLGVTAPTAEWGVMISTWKIPITPPRLPICSSRLR